MRLPPRLRAQFRTLLERLRQERGQAIVMVAVSMVFIAGFLALTLDAGYAYSQRRKMQNAADAAAQAAARILALNSACYGTPCPPYSDSHVESAIAYYVGQNQGSVDFVDDPPLYVSSSGQILGPVGTGAIPSTAAGTVITTTTTFPSFFAAVLGHSSLSVQTRSSALMAVSQMPTVSRPRDLVPLVVPLQDFVNNASTEFDLWGPQYGRGYNLPADFKALADLNSGSGPSYTPGAPCSPINSCLAQWSQFGFDGTVGYDDLLPAVSGDRRSQISPALIAYCESQNRSDAGGLYGLFKIAIFNSYDPTANKLHIMGFAQFKVYCNTIGNSMSGRFVSYMAPGNQIVPGGDTTVPGPRVVVFVDPFTGLPGGTQATATPTSVASAPAATETPSGPTSTPTATPTGSAGTPTATPTATPTPRIYTVEWWSNAQYATVSRGATNFYCDAGTATAGPIIWTSQASTDLYFVIWPADQIGPSSSQIPYHVDSGESFTQTLTSAGTYSVFVYDSGTNSNKDAVISSFPLRCQ